jgi:hypothetical protein
LRVEASFLRKADLGGLIWDSEDRLDHPLLAYRTDRDYSHTSLRFRWRSSGIVPLDVVNGSTLTIEGKDQSGVPRTWYVRLWNYAEGSGDDAVIALDFAQLDGGFSPSDADRVWPRAIERMFISFAPARLRRRQRRAAPRRGGRLDRDDRHRRRRRARHA